MSDQTENAARQTRTVEEAAQILGIGRNQAYAAVRRGEIPSLRIGARILVPEAALNKMLETPALGLSAEPTAA